MSVDFTGVLYDIPLRLKIITLYKSLVIFNLKCFCLVRNEKGEFNKTGEILVLGIVNTFLYVFDI